jgi:AraC-like DNA-binding protein
LEHLTEKVSCAFLAKLCCLSTAQFYNLFHAEYGVPPLEYRNDLLVRRATLLLKDGSYSVTEVAETLGFESVSYFSRFFKKHKGISPAQYIKKATS